MGNNPNTHLTLEDRKIIEQGISNCEPKASIAETLGKDKSTIGKEIKLHRILTYKCHMPLECNNYIQALPARQELQILLPGL